MGSRVLSHGTILYRMQFLVKAGIVKKPPLWLAVVEAFPPQPTPSFTGTRTNEIVYKEEDKHRKKLQESLKKPKLLSLFESYNIAGMPENNPVGIYDKTGTDDVEETSSNEEVSLKQEQSGYMSMLEMIDDLKHSTERNNDDKGDIKKPKTTKGPLLSREKDAADKIGDIFDSLEPPKNQS